MRAMCIKHDIQLVPSEETDLDNRVIKCPVDNCNTGLSSIDFINLQLGNIKPEKLGYRLKEGC